MPKAEAEVLWDPWDLASFDDRWRLHNYWLQQYCQQVSHPVFISPKESRNCVKAVALLPAKCFARACIATVCAILVSNY